jgi:PST family polysaccharide transporter
MTGTDGYDGNEDRGLGRRITVAAVWMVAFRWVDRVVGLFSVAVLARLLTPDDFGVVGYAMLVIGLVDLFTGLSTDAELIRQKDAGRSYYNGAWTMNCLRGLVVALAILGLTRPAVDFFHEPRLASVMLAVAAIPLIQGFENVGIIDFRKRLQFHLEFRFLLTVRLLRAAITIGLAFVLRNYWALVAGTVMGAAFRVGLSYGFHPFRPRFALARVPDIFRFSRWMIFQNVASGISTWLPGIVIGREWSSGTLAFFNMGKEIADLSTTEVRAPIRRALYPGLAQVADQRERLASVLVESTGMLALLTVPIPLGIALIANDLVPLFLGMQWQPTVEMLRPLCVAGSVAGIATNSQLALMALNRSHLTAIGASLRAILLLTVLLVVSPVYGAVGVAYAVASVTCTMAIADYALASRLLGIRAGRFIAVVWRPVIAALLMCVAVWLLPDGAQSGHDPTAHAWSLARAAVLGAAVYAAGVLFLWAIAGSPAGAERRLIAFARNYCVRRLARVR